MSVKRYIDTKFWRDPWIQSLNPSQKYFYNYLITNPDGNIAGVFELSIRSMCFDTGYNEETVKQLIHFFEEAGKIIYADNYIIIKNFLKHQNINPSIRKGIIGILANTPKTVCDRLCTGCDRVYTECLQAVTGCGQPATYLNLNLDLNNNLNLNRDLNLNLDKSKSNFNSKPSTKSYHPTLEEVTEYIQANNYNVDPESWFNFYESNGWIVGKVQMNNWKASIQAWHKRNKDKPEPKVREENKLCH